MANRPTLIPPPALNPKKSAMENALELTELAAIAPDIFSNTRPLWRPPGARGIYGGAVIAQCLAAAQRTVPPNFSVHSMHCYFVLAGDSDIPVMYYVEHVREGKSFATRTVQARQRGKAIFTTTLSFTRDESWGRKQIRHAVPRPKEVEVPEGDDQDLDVNQVTPFVNGKISILNPDSEHPHEKRTRQWIKARGRISNEGGHQAHLAALAYMSDLYFIGTVSRIHPVYRPGDAGNFRAEQQGVMNPKGLPEVSMMVSLDHSIYFHQPRNFRADEWIFVEMASPWSGEGRGVVQQHMFAADGTLIATCFQEGVVRLKEQREPSSKL